MRTITEHGYTTYPRRFVSYAWYKPLIVGVLFFVFAFICSVAIDPITKLIFGATGSSTGYDDMDFYTAAGAFNSTVEAVLPVMGLVIAALIVRDRPLSSYFSSMGGWRWGVFMKTFAVGLILVGVPVAAFCLMHGNSGVISFTIGGFIILTLLGPLQGVAEELMFRGYIMQTVSSWFKVPVIGIIVQIAVFAAVHPYNFIGVVDMVIAALLYALVCVYTRGLEAGSAMHIINNMTTIYLAGFGFGSITAEMTVTEMVFECGAKVLFFMFILFAAKRLHWFDEVKRDDVAAFNAKRMR